MAAQVKTVSTVSIPSVLLLMASAASAQTSTPATPMPGLEGFSLPSSRPTPRVPPDAEPTTGATAPRPTPAPTPAATPPAPVVTAPAPPPRVVPTVQVAPVPRPTLVPRVVVPVRPALVATPTPTPIASPAIAAPKSTASPIPIPSASPTADAGAPTPIATTLPQTESPTGTRSSRLPLILGVLLLVVIGFGALLAWRRRRADRSGSVAEDVPPHRAEGVAADESDATPALQTEPPMAAVAPRAPRARIEIDCVATRAGTNLLSAAVDYRIVVRNVGEALATGIRVDIRLLGMGTQHDALLDALFAMPIEKSIAAPFDLPPGTAVDLGGMAMHPKDTIETVEIGGRRMVVPLLSVNLRYGWPDDATGGGEGQTARPFVIGIDPGTGGRLQPFRLDAAARMVQNVAIIAYTDGVTT
jgi:hypothetical protein